jgi:hypothetical protein
MASTHTWDGVNYADAFHATLSIAGSVLILLGLGLGLSDRLVMVSIKRKENTLVP